MSVLGRARPLLVARALTAAATLVVPMALTRLLEPAEFGLYKQVWLVASTLLLVLPMGITQSLYYFVPREPERRGAYVAQSLVATTLAGAAAGALLLAAARLVPFDDPALAAAAPWTALLTALLLAGAALDAAYTSEGRIGAGAAARAATEIGRALAGLAGGLVTRSVTGVLAGLALATAVRAAATWIALGRAHGLHVSRAGFRRQLGYALPFGLAALLFVPQQYFHQYAVAGSVPAAEFAVYSVALFHLAFVDILYTPMSEVLQLGLAEADGRGAAGEKPALFHEAVSQLAVLLVPAAALLVAVAPGLVTFLFTDRYAGAVPILRLSALALLLGALPLDGVLRAHAQRRFMLGTSALKLALTVPAVLLGLRLAGPIGALGGWLAAEGLVRAVQLARVARLFGVPLLRVLPAGRLARMGLAAGVAAPAAWALAAHGPGPLAVRLFAAGAAALGLYAALVVLLGALPLKLAARTAMRFNAAAWRRLLPRPAPPPPPPPAAS